MTRYMMLTRLNITQVYAYCITLPRHKVVKELRKTRHFSSELPSRYTQKLTDVSLHYNLKDGKRITIEAA